METEKSLLVNFDQSKIDLIKRTVAQGSTDDELAMFMHQCQRTGLDPMLRQIYMIKRDQWDSQLGRKVSKATIQVSIDGFRLVADRTGKYAPGEEKFEMGQDGYPVAAHVSVKKLVGDTWHEVWASAYWSEYAQVYNGKLGSMWARFPRTMLAKCAESKALRKAFPAELSGLYTTEEMPETEHVVTKAFELPKEPLKDEKGAALIEAEPSPDKPNEMDFIKKLNDEQKRVALDLIDLSVELIGMNENDVSDLLEMCSEYRNKNNTVERAGVRKFSALNYSRAGRAKMSQAEYTISRMRKLTKENVKNELALWRESK